MVSKLFLIFKENGLNGEKLRGFGVKTLRILDLMSFSKFKFCFNHVLIRFNIVAIKKFKESAEEDEIVKKTTKREVKMLSVLKDKNYVVRMIEAFKR